MKIHSKKRPSVLFVAAAVLLAAVAATGCTFYEKAEIEIIRCPQVQDTVQIPGWDNPSNDTGHDTGI